MQYKLLSLDVFFTLADLGACYRPTWERALRRSVSDEELERLNAAFDEVHLPLYYALPVMPFRTMEDIFTDGFAHAKRKLALPLDPEETARIFCEEHSRAPLYPDVKPSLERISQKCDVAVSSDADCSMLQGLTDDLPLRWRFASEELRCYKKDQKKRFFSQVLQKTGLKPEEILHVGDSDSDVLGASACGIHTCLITRTGEPSRDLAKKAQFCVRSLEELDF